MNRHVARIRGFKILVAVTMFVLVSQTACVPTDAEGASMLANQTATQLLEFVMSFARSALAAFLL